MAVSLLHDNDYGFLNQYGRVESAIDLGSFDFSIFESLGQLRFYPNKFTVNDYDISTVSFNIADNIGVTTNVSLGDIVKIGLIGESYRKEEQDQQMLSVLHLPIVHLRFLFK